MSRLTITIPEIAEQLSVSPDAVRQWAAARRWPNGREMLGMKLTSAGPGRLRIFMSDFEQYMREAAEQFNAASVIMLTAEKSPMRTPLTKAMQRQITREKRLLDAMQPRRRVRPAPERTAGSS